MKKFLKLLAGVAILLIIIGAGIWNTKAGQDWLLQRGISSAMALMAPAEEYDGLKVFMCGTSSPLPAPNRAQACVAVFAGDSMYVVDTGAGSAQVAALRQLPFERLKAVFLTHYHSDHIAALPDFNLNSWVAGRPEPLKVYGPAGVTEVVDGLNEAYSLDRSYRIEHHGEEMLPPGNGVMQANVMDAGTALEIGELTITSFQVNHDPVRPAVGYRFDYRGRSVVISGDAIVTPSLIGGASGADLLLQDALSLPIIQSLEKAMAGTRLENVLHDIQEYHAPVSDLQRLVDESGVRQLALYHLVPAPRNALFRKFFTREMPAGTILTEDGMVFELPANSEEINVIDP